MTAKKPPPDPEATPNPEVGKEGGGAQDTQAAATNDDPNGSPNPPTQKVPPQGIQQPYLQDAGDGTIQESAPVWEGGDPGEAVQSANQPDPQHPFEEDTTYHPEGEGEPVDDDETPPAQPDITLPDNQQR